MRFSLRSLLLLTIAAAFASLIASSHLAIGLLIASPIPLIFWMLRARSTTQLKAPRWRNVILATLLCMPIYVAATGPYFLLFGYCPFYEEPQFPAYQILEAGKYVFSPVFIAFGSASPMLDEPLNWYTDTWHEYGMELYWRYKYVDS